MKKSLPPNLRTYQKKRNFSVTSEPPPAPAKPHEGPPSFMVHKHDARRLHYDLRLEMDGALASWAVPKGPSFDPKIRRLAVQTEDHPLEYGGFEGRIPEGEYGAGDSIIWDRGVYDTVPPGAGSAMRKKGHVEFVLMGEKLKGRWHLVRTQGTQGGKPTWILFKGHDEFADEKYDVVAERPESVATGKRITRGPTAVAVRESRATPLHVLLRIWPPMLAGRAPRPPSAKTHLFEAHADGPRALAGVAQGRVALQSEEGRDLGAAHPAVVKALAPLDLVEAALDGELSADGETYVVHDLLWLDGKDLRPEPYEHRRELLADILSGKGSGTLVLAPLVETPTPPRGFARVSARRRRSPYASGESTNWVTVEAAKPGAKTAAKPGAKTAAKPGAKTAGTTRAKPRSGPATKPRTGQPEKLRSGQPERPRSGLPAKPRTKSAVKSSSKPPPNPRARSAAKRGAEKVRARR